MYERFPRCQVLFSKPNSVVSIRTFAPRLYTLYVSLGQRRDIKGTKKILKINNTILIKCDCLLASNSQKSKILKIIEKFTKKTRINKIEKKNF